MRWSQRCWAQALREVSGFKLHASYNVYTGLHQRCWVHLLRDRHKLKEQYPEYAEVQQWAKDVKAIYDRAIAYAGPELSLPAAKQEAARRTHQHAFEQELWQVCAPFAHTSSPLHTLCERVERFCLNCLSLLRFPACLLIIISLSAAFVRWSLRAKSAGALAVPWSETRMGLSALCNLDGTFAQPLSPMRGRPLPKLFTSHVNSIRKQNPLTKEHVKGIVSEVIMQCSSLSI